MKADIKKIEQLLHKNNKKFYKIFDEAIQKDGDFITCGGKLSYDELINTHLRAWYNNRVNGMSASMAFYAEETAAINLIDQLVEKMTIETIKEQAKLLCINVVSGSASDFEKDLGKLINVYSKAGLKKPDLVRKMEWMTGNCKFS